MILIIQITADFGMLEIHYLMFENNFHKIRK